MTPCIHAAAVPTAAAAAGIMMPSPGHKPTARAATRIAAGRRCDRQVAAMVRRPWAALRAIRRGRRRGQRGDPVQHGADPPGEGQQADRRPHHRRLDPPAIGPAAGHAGDQPVRAARHPRRGVGRATIGRIVPHPTPIGHRVRHPIPGASDQGHPRWRRGRQRPYCRTHEPLRPDRGAGRRHQLVGGSPGAAATTRQIAVDDDRILGGVAGFLARRLGVDALWVRIGFVLLALAGGDRPRAVRRAVAGADGRPFDVVAMATHRRRCDRRRRDPVAAERPGRSVRDRTGRRGAAPQLASPWRCGGRRTALGVGREAGSRDR